MRQMTRLWLLLALAALLWVGGAAPALAHYEEIDEVGDPRLLTNAMGALWFLGTVSAAALVLWGAWRAGQFKDPESPARRMLENDDEERLLIPLTEVRPEEDDDVGS